jgi:hypothetical protein
MCPCATLLRQRSNQTTAYNGPGHNIPKLRDVLKRVMKSRTLSAKPSKSRIILMEASHVAATKIQNFPPTRSITLPFVNDDPPAGRAWGQPQGRAAFQLESSGISDRQTRNPRSRVIVFGCPVLSRKMMSGDGYSPASTRRRGGGTVSHCQSGDSRGSGLAES